MNDEKNRKDDLQEQVGEAAESVKEGVEDVADKIQAGAKAVVKKIKDPDKDLETEYYKEQLKEKMD